ncbi:MAG: hypothetical protein ACNS63_04350 [Candidatus Nitrospinota bacterium M3_3B_026]
MKEGEVVFHTNDIRIPLALSCVPDRELSFNWGIRIRLEDPSGYSVRIANEILRFGFRKNLLKERERILRLVEAVREYVNGDPGEERHAGYDVPVVQAVGQESAVETWVGCLAMRAERDEFPEGVVFAAKTAGLPEKCHGSIGYTTVLDLSVIEEGVRPLVLALNGAGTIRTTYSCQGHYTRHPRSPFVRFLAPRPADVFALREAVSETKTRYRWAVQGRPWCGGVHWELTTSVKRSPWSSARLRRDISDLSWAIFGRFMTRMEEDRR